MPTTLLCVAQQHGDMKEGEVCLAMSPKKSGRQHSPLLLSKAPYVKTKVARCLGIIMVSEMYSDVSAPNATCTGFWRNLGVSLGGYIQPSLGFLASCVCVFHGCMVATEAVVSRLSRVIGIGYLHSLYTQYRRCTYNVPYVPFDFTKSRPP